MIPGIKKARTQAKKDPKPAISTPKIFILTLTKNPQECYHYPLKIKSAL